MAVLLIQGTIQLGVDETTYSPAYAFSPFGLSGF